MKSTLSNEGLTRLADQKVGSSKVYGHSRRQQTFSTTVSINGSEPKADIAIFHQAIRAVRLCGRWRIKGMLN